MPGPQFFETGMGRKFFESQLPALIKAIQENTAAIITLAEIEKEKKL